MTNLSSMRLTPGTRRITSPALVSCVFVISCADTLLTMTGLLLVICITAISVFFLATPVTVTSFSVCSSGVSFISNTCG